MKKYAVFGSSGLPLFETDSLRDAKSWCHNAFIRGSGEALFTVKRMYQRKPAEFVWGAVNPRIW